jgi:hypothetical protein
MNDPGELTFQRNIRPLFRSEDIDAMSFAFDLSSAEDVRAYAEEIYERLTDGTMPCDAPWSDDDVVRFRRWVDEGARP